MALRIGYLLPTRESIMEGRPAAAPLLALAERAESLGFDSVWIGDSLTSRPRHEPLTMLAAVAARTQRVALGTAVLLPALRNPVQLAHQAATVDQVSEGRLILGIGIAQDLPKIREEFEAAGVPFEKRVGRLLEGMRLCRALWTGRPVDWDGRWTLRQATIGPTPHRPGGPPIWAGGMVGAARERAAKYFDAWFPNGPQPDRWASGWQEVRDFARTAGRDPGEITGASYLTLYLDEDRSRAQARIELVPRALLRPAGGGATPSPHLLRRPAGRSGGMAGQVRRGRGKPPGAALRRRSRAPDGRRFPAARNDQDLRIRESGRPEDRHPWQRQ